MILGTSPSVGAHEALLGGSSLARGILGRSSPAPVPASHGSASPAHYRGGVNVLSSSPSENGNGNSMIGGGGGGGGAAGAGGSSLSSGYSHGGSLSHSRRRSAELRAGGAIYVKSVVPVLAPTVTGFNVPQEASRDAHDDLISGGVGSAAARMTQNFQRTPSPATQRSDIHQHDYELVGAGGIGGAPSTPAPVVGFNAPASASPGSGGFVSSGGGLTKSLSALQYELQSAYDGVEATIAVPAVSNAAHNAHAARPPSGRGMSFTRKGSFGSLSRLSPGVAEKPPSGLLSGVTTPLEALEPEEEAMLFEAQGRHAAFKSAQVVSAFRVAAAAHRGQRRRSGDPVLRHCVETAVTLAELGMDYTVVSAGLLHDVLDDTAVTAAELRTVSGAAITGMVQGVSRLSHVSQITRDSGLELGSDERQRLRAMLIAMTDARVVIVKLADRLHSLSTLHHLDADKARGIAEETLAVYVPLASRLGIWTLKARLEDACFARLHPEEHSRLSAELEEGGQRAAITGVVEAITSVLDTAGVLAGCSDICGRPKSLHSVFRKMRKKGVALEDIHDVRALRVIVATEEDCYAALQAVHSRPGWSAVKGKTKDYVRNAKHNGYQSLHTVVCDDATGDAFEVQIRTGAMHHAAEYGLAAHWRYKEVPTSSASESAELSTSKASASDATHKAVDEQVAWARFMLSWQGQLADNKCRAEGAEGGFAGAGAGGGAGAGVMGEFCLPCPCPFPTHHLECHNHEDNLGFGCGGAGGAGGVVYGGASSAMWDSLDSPLVSADSASAGGCFFSPDSPLMDAAAAGSATAAAPIFVIAVVDGEMRVVEVPRGARLSDVDVVSIAGRATAFTSAVQKSVAVNRETVPPGAEVAVQLRMGDLIEVTTTTKAAVHAPCVVGSAAAAAVEKQRRRLSGSLSSQMSAIEMDVSALNLDQLSNNVVKRGPAPKGFHP